MRENRLANQRQYQKEKVANESIECGDNRLANKRQYQKEKIANESVECRQETSQQQYRKNIATNSTITDEIRKFHAVVSRGPLYICACCDQL